MATRKTAAKTPAAKAARKTAAKAETRPATAAATRAAPAKPSKPAQPAPGPAAATKAGKPVGAPTGEARYRWIAHAAYLRAEKRGFAPGQEVDDWLAAEAEFLTAHGLA